LPAAEIVDSAASFVGVWADEAGAVALAGGLGSKEGSLGAAPGAGETATGSLVFVAGSTGGAVAGVALAACWVGAGGGGSGCELRGFASTRGIAAIDCGFSRSWSRTEKKQTISTLKIMLGMT
jgi:hypothetical protein